MNDLFKKIHLKDKIALITGASGNLGKEFAKSLSHMDADLILVDKEKSKLLELKESIQEQSKSKIYMFECDFSSKSEKDMLVSTLNSQFKSLDILINNAAFVGDSNLPGWNTDFKNQKIENWDEVFEVNLFSIFQITQGLVQMLKRADNPSIINISSIYGDLGPDLDMYEDTNINNPAAYGASKAGLIQLTKWLACNLGPKIRVNAIVPGGIERNQPKIFRDRYSNKTVLKRMATENDMQGALIFFATNMSLYVTGHALYVDGGYTIK